MKPRYWIWILAAALPAQAQIVTADRTEREAVFAEDKAFVAERNALITDSLWEPPNKDRFEGFNRRGFLVGEYDFEDFWNYVKHISAGTEWLNNSPFPPYAAYGGTFPRDQYSWRSTAFSRICGIYDTDFTDRFRRYVYDSEVGACERGLTSKKEAEFRALFARTVASGLHELAAETRRQGTKKRREAMAKAWDDAAEAWDDAAEVWGAFTEAQAQVRAQKAQAREREQAEAVRIQEEREQAARNAQRTVAAAWRAQQRAWEAEADYGFVAYDGANSHLKSNASSARIKANLARNGDLRTARSDVSQAHLHALRARENASEMRYYARNSTGGLKELANKTAQAWESAAREWDNLSGE